LWYDVRRGDGVPSDNGKFRAAAAMLIIAFAMSLPFLLIVLARLEASVYGTTHCEELYNRLGILKPLVWLYDLFRGSA
jgi:hypothetical protein